ncbi:DUF2690 domain-containing protein [Micromonospora sp. NPDC049051]|uniref:DUF2690 domain-containing protein n=1 Tax=Micromonospora sp. NPDC049051 TaxID=3364264 RepID=UPI00371181E7
MLRKKFAHLSAALAIGLTGVVAPQAAFAAPPAAPSSAVEQPATVTAEELDPQTATMIPEVELAATGCGSVCDGKNPATYKIYHSGCSTCYHYCADDAETVASNTSGINLELRYSPRCRTAWARVSSDFYYPTVRSYHLSGAVRTSYSGFAGAYYTYMVNDAGLLARAEASAGSTTWYTSKY